MRDAKTGFHVPARVNVFLLFMCFKLLWQQQMLTDEIPSFDGDILRDRMKVRLLNAASRLCETSPRLKRLWFPSSSKQLFFSDAVAQ